MAKINLSAIKEKMDDAKNKATDVVANIKERTERILDQDGDGKFDINDLKKVGNEFVGGVNSLKDAINEKVNEYKIDRDNPVFVSTLENPLFVLPKVVCILEASPMQSKYPDSIGYVDEIKNTSVLCLYYTEAKKTGFNFHPSLEYKTMYYVDNSKEKHIF